MKKFLLWLMIIVMAVSMLAVFSSTGCKAGDAVSEEETAAETSEEKAAEETAAETSEEGTEETVAKELTVLLNSHYVPANDEYLAKVIDEWAAANGVTVTVDFNPVAEMESKIVSEIEVGSGHDVAVIRDYTSYIYNEGLADVGELVDEIIAENGEMDNLGEKVSLVNGVWRSVPWYHQSFPIVYRKDLCEEVGYSVEDMNSLTFDGLLDLAKKLDEKGNGGVGIPVSACDDSTVCMTTLLWAFGGALLDKDNSVVITSDETKAALEYIQELGKYMPQEVTGWDGAGNNVYMLSGEGAVSANPPSIYASAIKDNLEFASELYHAPFPSGSAGWYRFTGSYSLGILESSNNKELAGELIKHLLSADIFIPGIDVSNGYNQPIYGDLTSDYWSNIPALSGLELLPEELLYPSGWPGPDATPTVASIRAQLNYTIPIMFSKVLAGEATPDEAMAWAQAEMERYIQEEAE